MGRPEGIADDGGRQLSFEKLAFGNLRRPLHECIFVGPGQQALGGCFSASLLRRPAYDAPFTVYAVRDTKRARDFYTKTVGLRETANWDDKWIEFDVGPGTLAITDSFEQLKPGAKGAMVALEVTDLDAAIRELESKGVKLTMPKFDTPVCCGCTISDPDGNEIMLHQRKRG